MSTALIIQHVREECMRRENAFGPSFFDQHLAVVADYGQRLAACLGADSEIVELAAYLHDLAAVRNFLALREHASLSADIARELLTGEGYPARTIERVARCISTHSAPIGIGGGSLEEVCVSNADAISQIVRPAYWLFYAYGVRKLGCEEGRQWLLQRVETNWNALAGLAKDMTREGYALATSVLAD